MAYSSLGQLHMLAHEHGQALAATQQAMALAEALEDLEVLCHALNNAGSADYAQGDAAAGQQKLERSLRLALQHGFEEHAARAYINLACSAIEHRAYDQGRRYLQAGIAYCQERDLDAWSLYLRAWRARAALEEGDWMEAGQEAQAVLGQERPAWVVDRIVALVVLGTLRARRGDPGARPLLDEARDLALPTGELQRIGPVAAARAEAAWLVGAADWCAAEAQVGYELALTGERAHAWQTGQLAAWLWRVGALVAPPAVAAEPYALQMAGDWRAAAEAWQRLGCPYERALALMEGDSTAQVQALGIFQDLGAGPAALQVARKLGRAPPRHLSQEQFGGLTEREQQVAILVAQGRSNREIAEALVVSVRTIETYVTRILNKLALGSRVQVATWAIEKGLAPATGRSTGLDAAARAAGPDTPLSGRPARTGEQ
jgi:DNA-binding CsgD family transcriptional regulator